MTSTSIWSSVDLVSFVNAILLCFNPRVYGGPNLKNAWRSSDRKAITNLEWTIIMIWRLDFYKWRHGGPKFNMDSHGENIKKIIAHKEAAMERQTFGLAHQFDV